MTDIDPDREWYYSITVATTDDSTYPLRGVIRQGPATTRRELVDRILTRHRLNVNTRTEVHSLERNDL